MFNVDVDRQNTGGCTNPKGQYIAFGKRGNSDITGMIPWRSGCKFDLEIKRFGFRPNKLRGGKRERIRFDAQIARLRRTNEGGGVGLWIDDAAVLPHVFQRLKEGWRVEIGEDEFPYLTND